MAALQLLIHLAALLLLLQGVVSAGARRNTIHSHCREFCGNHSIPYPFGIGPGCYRDKRFEIACEETDDGTLPFSLGSLGNKSTLQIFNISVSQNQAILHKHLSYHCYNSSGVQYKQLSGLNLTGTPFTISATHNKFTAIGCNTKAYIFSSDVLYASGCMSFCDKLESITSGQCNGIGCCQTSLPENLIAYRPDFDIRRPGDPTWNFDPCSYSFVADHNWFKFDNYNLKGYNYSWEYQQGVPLVLDWLAGSGTCEEARKNVSTYACRSRNSDCLYNSQRNGYACNCTEGYEGNPYLEDGCQDINECDDLHQNPCLGICQNKEGNYSCSCPPGYHSEDPKRYNCVPDPSLPLWTKLALGIAACLISMLILSFSICMIREKRKHAEEKEKFFQRNGGMLLYEELRSKQDIVMFKIYRKEELERATNNFDPNLILGRGGQGTVYRGTLKGNLIVAIKKAKTIDESQKEQFVKEILVLSQINHNNVVKLLGCCLEVEVPMLVYEFVFNGALHDYIHGQRGDHPIPFNSRLRIAIESAEALAYLHSSASPPILHRDVKSSNILLDENYVAKVSDFGTSVVITNDEAQFATVIQGTFGYLDPEVIQSHVFTEKSDVYSFGVVLLELLTRKPAYSGGAEEEKNLASTFISLIKQGRAMECLDRQLINEVPQEVLQKISELVMQCLSMRGEDRPTMKEVAKRLTKVMQHPRGQHIPEESMTLLFVPPSRQNPESLDFTTPGYTEAFNIQAGR